MRVAISFAAAIAVVFAVHSPWAGCRRRVQAVVREVRPRTCPSGSRLTTASRAELMIDQQMRRWTSARPAGDRARHRGKPTRRRRAPWRARSRDRGNYILSGSGTNRTGADIVDAQRRPASTRGAHAERPGSNGMTLRGGTQSSGGRRAVTGGTGHQFMRSTARSRIHGARGSGQDRAADGLSRVARVAEQNQPHFGFDAGDGAGVLAGQR